MTKIRRFNESESVIDWRSAESAWDDYIEETYNEADYDDEFYELKRILSVYNVDIPWKEIQKEYFRYIEESNNEDDHDDKFKKFKSIVLKSI